MKQLNYQTLQDLNYDGYLLNEAPERVLQFGKETLCAHLSISLSIK